MAQTELSHKSPNTNPVNNVYNCNNKNERKKSKNDRESEKFRGNYTEKPINLKICGVNVRSLRTAVKKLPLQQILIQEVYDVVMVCETWLETEFNPANKNYQIFQTNNPSGYRGTLIAVKKNIVAIREEMDSANMTVVRIINEDGRHFLVMAIYFPPDDESWKLVRDELRNYVEVLRRKYQRVSLLVCGDINSDLRSETKRRELGLSPQVGGPLNFEVRALWDPNPLACTHRQVVLTVK